MWNSVIIHVYENIRKVFSELTVYHVTMFRWHRLFTSGKESVKHERRGRLTTTKTNLKTSHRSNRFWKNIIESAVGWQWRIRDTKNNRWTHFTGWFEKRKQCSHFIPHALTTDQRQQEVSHTEYLLEMIENNLHFVDSIIAGHNNPLTKRQNAAWVGPKCKRTSLPKIENQNNAYPIFQ